ncbi:MAG: MATE family efflux transporter, partial [Actinobacteria bacterium]|nr:MATE family efflux transporter [Actinomycetota bacterium]
ASHQVAVELWMFLAMVMDSIAIAGQALTGRYLGAGRIAEAERTAKRMIVWGVAFGALLGGAYWLARDLLPRIFTNDQAVIAGVVLVLPFLAAFQPLNGYVFVLDGILIGASDARFLARGMLVSAGVAIPVALLALRFDWGLRGIWTGLSLFMVLRAVTNGLRFRSGRWLRSGDARMGVADNRQVSLHGRGSSNEPDSTWPPRS